MLSDTTAPYAATWNALGRHPGAHTITATAYDAAGNNSVSTVTVTVPAPDPTPPVTTLTSPGDGAMVSGSVGIAATAVDDGSGVAKVEFLVDGVLIGSDTSSPYGQTWSARDAALGAHEIQAKAYDRAGNTAVSRRSVTVAADSVPTVSITSPQDNAVVSGSVQISADATDSATGIAKVEFRVNGSYIGRDTTYPYERVWDAASAAPGTYTVEVRAYNRVRKLASSRITLVVAPASAAGTVLCNLLLSQARHPSMTPPNPISGLVPACRVLPHGRRSQLARAFDFARAVLRRADSQRQSGDGVAECGW